MEVWTTEQMAWASQNNPFISQIMLNENELSNRLAKLEARLPEKVDVPASEMTDAEASTLLDTLDRRQNPLSSSFHNRSVIKSIRRPVDSDALKEAVALLSEISRNAAFAANYRTGLKHDVTNFLKKHGGE